MAVVRPMIVSPIYGRILSKFPHNFAFCFAYGSAVKKQLANKKKDNMVDLIYCVDNPFIWHESNIKTNPSHYSSLKYLGPNFVVRFQENFGAKVYFNTLVPLEEDLLIKYGVISTKDLITDLLEWSDLYLAGRLHKPVEIITKPSNAELVTALQLNLQSAVHAALLLLPDAFSEYEFYYTITSLSYSGDFRMTFGENKNKVENIVRPQLAGFRNLYSPFLSTLSDYVEFPMLQLKNKDEEVSSCCCQDVSPLAKLHHLNQLPRWPQKRLTRFWNRGSLRQDTEDCLRAIAYDPDCNLIVQQCISDIVFTSSVNQSLKNIPTAGLMKTMPRSCDSDLSPRDRSRSPRSSPPKDVIGPTLPPHLLKKAASGEEAAVIGPALPPHLLKKEREAEPEASKACIGPQLPPHLRGKIPENSSSDSEEEVYGPLPPSASKFSKTHVALEERALELKLQQLEPQEDQLPVREEWMLELPEVKAAKFGLGPRQFRSKAGPDMSDRSSWTDIGDKKEKKKEAKVDLKKDAEVREIRRRDDEQEKMSKKYKKNKESLLEIHQKKLKNKEKEEGGPSERRPFSREIDLQVNRFDEAQKKAVLKKAQLLDDRFSSGQSKFL